MRALRTLAVVLAAAAIPLAAPPAQRPAPPARTVRHADAGPAALVRAFYTFHFAHDMAFSRAAVRARSRWLAPDLLEQIRAYFARPSDPNEVPAIDGDPFTDSQEYPRTFQVGPERTSGDTARVAVAMLWPEGDRRAVSVVLTRVGGAWRIANVRYKAGESSLRELLATGK